jgi:hypothetical protein
MLAILFLLYSIIYLKFSLFLYRARLLFFLLHGTPSEKGGKRIRKKSSFRRAVHEWVEIVFIVKREQLGYAKINKENGTLNIFYSEDRSSEDLRVWRKEILNLCCVGRGSGDGVRLLGEAENESGVLLE